MNNLVTRGLNNSSTHLLLRGLGGFVAAVSTVPGSYRGVREHPIFKILQRGLEVRQLHWNTEEINPMIVFVSIEKDKQSVPVKIVILNSENVDAKAPIAMLATEYIDLKIKMTYPTTEFVEAKIPIIISQEESILGCLNIYDETEWASIKPAAVFSLSKGFEIKSLSGLKITKTKELELIGK